MLSNLNPTFILDEEPATTEGNNVEDEYEYDEENNYEGEGTEEGAEEGTEEGGLGNEVVLGEDGSENGVEQGSEQGAEDGSENGDEQGSEQGAENGSGKDYIEEVQTDERNADKAYDDYHTDDEDTTDSTYVVRNLHTYFDC